MAELSQELQQELREYGQKLHVAQRGIFFEFADEPRWKKLMVQAMIPSLSSFIESTHDLNVQTLVDFVCDNKQELDRADKNVFVAFISFVFQLFVLPILLFIYSPIVWRFFIQKTRWYSHESESFMYAALLGSLLDSSR